MKLSDVDVHKLNVQMCVNEPFAVSVFCQGDFVKQLHTLYLSCLNSFKLPKFTMEVLKDEVQVQDDIIYMIHNLHEMNDTMADIFDLIVVSEFKLHVKLRDLVEKMMNMFYPRRE